MSVKVSVIMPVYNADKTLRQAIESILKQSFQDFELIICNDGSDPKTTEILNMYSGHTKIKILTNDKNQGRSVSRNRCLAFAEGEYIALQDADDLSTESRLFCQVNFLEKHPEYSVVSSWADLIDEQGKIWGTLKPLSCPDKFSWLYQSQTIHAAAMIRTANLKSVNGYDESIRRCEDYELWIRFVEKGHQFYNLQEAHYKIQYTEKDYQRRTLASRVEEFLVRLRAIKKLRPPVKYYLGAFKPLLLIMAPLHLQYWYHRLKFKS